MTQTTAITYPVDLPIKTPTSLMTREGLILNRLSSIALYKSKYGMRQRIPLGRGEIENLRLQDRYLYDMCLSEAKELGLDVKTYVETLGFVCKRIM